MDRFDTPIGEMIIVADRDRNLRAATGQIILERLQKLLRRHYGRNGFTFEPVNNPSGLTDVMKSYFAGELAAIDGLPVQTAGTTFQGEVWRALRKIPSGTTVSCQARRTDRPTNRRPGRRTRQRPIPSELSCLVTASYDPTARSPDTAAASSANAGFWTMKTSSMMT